MAERDPKLVERWDPIRELDLLRGWPFREGRLARGVDVPAGRWAPAVDVTERDDRYLVTCELAGAKKEDVTIEAHENVLTIRGEKRSERDEKDEKRHYVERSYGSFSRSFTLPSDAALDHVHATFSDGVLTVEIPKHEASKPRTIAIK